MKDKMRENNESSTRQPWRLAVVMAVCLIGVGLAPQKAKADTVIGASSQDVVFTGDGLGDLSAVLGACSFNGTDTTCTLSGSSPTSYSLDITYAGTTDATVFGPNNGSGVFPVSANWLTSSVTLNGTTYGLIYSTADDGSLNPHFDGVWTGGTTFDYTLNNITCSVLPCTLENVADTSGATASATISSGEFVAIPEPGSLVLIGSGLLGLAGFLRRRVLG
jgi:hypothetical protein